MTDKDEPEFILANGLWAVMDETIRYGGDETIDTGTCAIALGLVTARLMAVMDLGLTEDEVNRCTAFVSKVAADTYVSYREAILEEDQKKEQEIKDGKPRKWTFQYRD